MLAYYVEWHVRRVLAPILFTDEILPEERMNRDPVLPAKPSESVKRKKLTHQTEDGLPVHSFETLMAELVTRGRVTCRLKSDEVNLTFNEVPDPTPNQARAYELLGVLPVTGN